jgi:hypothetical protein
MGSGSQSRNCRGNCAPRQQDGGGSLTHKKLSTLNRCRHRSRLYNNDCKTKRWSFIKKRIYFCAHCIHITEPHFALTLKHKNASLSLHMFADSNLGLQIDSVKFCHSAIYTSLCVSFPLPLNKTQIFVQYRTMTLF